MARDFAAAQQLIQAWDPATQPLESLAAHYAHDYSLGQNHSQFSPGLEGTQYYSLSIRLDKTGRVYDEIQREMLGVRRSQKRYFLNGQPNTFVANIMIGLIPQKDSVYLYAERGDCLGVGCELPGNVGVEQSVPLLYMEKRLIAKEGGFMRKAVILLPKGVRAAGFF